MHPNGNLGPTDPQITKAGKQPSETVRFGSEDLSAFLKFAKETVGLKEQALLAQVFQKFCDEVGAVGVGVAARGALLSLALGEKLLQLHMKGDGKAKTIAEKLTKDFFHHGYPVNRSEAVDIGLNVAKGDQDIEDLMWLVWTQLSGDLKLREPFSAVGLVRQNPACAPLFAPVPTVTIPPNLPPEVLQQVIAGVLQQCAVSNVPGTPFQTVHAVVESGRLASQWSQSGLIFANRQPDLTFKVSHIVDRQGWETVYPEPNPRAENVPEAPPPQLNPGTGS